MSYSDIRGYRSFQIHKALNLHYDDGIDYDAFKYNFKTKVNHDTFLRSNYRWQYVGLEKFGDNLLYYFYLKYKNNKFKPIFVFKGLMDKKIRTYEILNSMFEDHQKQLHKEIDDLKKYSDNELKSVEGIYPKLYNMMKSNEIMYETFVYACLYRISIMNVEASPDPLSWPDVIREYEQNKNMIVRIFGSK